MRSTRKGGAGPDTCLRDWRALLSLAGASRCRADANSESSWCPRDRRRVDALHSAWLPCAGVRSALRPCGDTVEIVRVLNGRGHVSLPPGSGFKGLGAVLRQRIRTR